MFAGKFINQRGFGVAYILSIIALLSLVVFSVANGSRGVAQSRINYETKIAIMEQVDLIRNRILVCGIVYPGGHNGSANRVKYPPKPVSGLLADATCPGQPPPNNLWRGTGGLLLPPPPRGFSEWTYENDGASMRIMLTATNPTDPTAIGIIDAILPRLGSNASRAGGVLTIILMA